VDSETTSDHDTSVIDHEPLKKYHNIEQQDKNKNKVEAFFSHAADALVDSARLFIRDQSLNLCSFIEILMHPNVFGQLPASSLDFPIMKDVFILN
jgi:hypothetical protein